jgi:hypothetical protein
MRTLRSRQLGANRKQEPDNGQCRLLGAGRERLCCRAAEQRYELAASHACSLRPRVATLTHRHRKCCVVHLAANDGCGSPTSPSGLICQLSPVAWSAPLEPWRDLVWIVRSTPISFARAHIDWTGGDTVDGAHAW